MVTCGYAQGTTLRHAHPRAIVLNSVDSLTFNASHFSHTPSHSNSAPRPWMSQPTNRTPDGARHTPHTSTGTARAGPYRTMSHVIPHGHFSTTPQNVAIPRLRIQSLKYPRGNYVRHSWRARRRAGPGASRPGGKQARRQAGPQAPRQGHQSQKAPRTHAASDDG